MKNHPFKSRPIDCSEIAHQIGYTEIIGFDTKRV